MSISPFSMIEDGWMVLGILFLVSSLATKRTAYDERLESRLPHLMVTVAGFALVFDASLPVGVLNCIWLRPYGWLMVVGGLLCLAGWGLTVWARVLIGGNWSASVMMKEGHTLTQRGPYAVVRHPIYTGMLTALLGTALVDGHIRSAVGFVVLVVLLKVKSEGEERLMRRAFGAAYDAYYRTTGALVPRLR